MLINDETKRIVIEKSDRKYQLKNQEFQPLLHSNVYNFELDANGSANIEIPTDKSDTNFELIVRVNFQYSSVKKNQKIISSIFVTNLFSR